MPGDYVGISGINDRMFMGPAKELIRVMHEKLVERVCLSHENRKRFHPPTPCPPGLLTCGHHRTRVTGDNNSIEGADIDPQLKGVGRDNPFKSAFFQLPLECTSLFREISGPVRGYRLCKARRSPTDIFPRKQGDQLRHLP